MPEIMIRRMTMDDVDGVYAVEIGTFVDAWSRDAFVTHGLLQYLSNLGAAYATPEVRRSNEIAQNLYKSLGFVQLGVRKRYYADNGEDALIMVCDHMPAADPDFTEAETVFEE